MQEEIFESRDAASVAAAERIAGALERRLSAQGAASLIVSGGTTPARCFEALSERSLDWPNVHVVLSDERWVAPDDDDSNEKLVRETLLRNKAADAILHGIYDADGDVESRCEAFASELHTLPFPFACALLGMGSDGHFASLFPDAAGLSDALDPDHPALCIPVTTAASPHPRFSLTLTTISRSDEIVLLAFGDDKRATLETAKASPDALPVSRLLTQKRAPVRIYWAP